MIITFYKDNRIDQEFKEDASNVIKRYMKSNYYPDYLFSIPVFCNFLGNEYGTYDQFTDQELDDLVLIYKRLKNTQ